MTPDLLFALSRLFLTEADDAPGAEADRLIAIGLEIRQRAALDTGIQETEFRLDYKRNAKGELVVALIIAETAKGFGSISVP